MNHLAASLNPKPEENSSPCIQVELPIELPYVESKAPRRGRNKTRAPEWGTYEIYRRAIRDGCISPGAFRLWHHLRDSLLGGKVRLHYGIAGVIAKLIHCKQDSVYKWAKELHEAGWLTWQEVGPHGEREYIPQNGWGVAYKPQPELPLSPFRVSATPIQEERYPHKGGAHKESKGTESVKGESNAPPRYCREDWQIKAALKLVRDEISALGSETLLAHDEATKRELVKRLRLKERNLQRELTGLPPEGTRMECQEAKLTQRPGPPAKVTTSPERLKELVDQTRRAIEAA